MSSHFAPLIEFLERRFSGVEEQLADLDQGFDTLQAAVDGYAKRADAYRRETVVRTRHVEPHERRLHGIADKLGVKLEH